MGSHAWNQLFGMLGNRIFLSAFFSWFIAQLLKSLIDAIRARHRSSRELMVTIFWKTGGMPSSHSALVTSLATSIGFRHGINTPLFTLALFYGILIIRDALGVRRAAGDQAHAMNSLGQELSERFGVRFQPVKEVNGHTPTEVSIGVLLGFFIAVAFSIL